MTDLLSTKRQELLTLSTKKQSLETEVSAIISELTSPIILPSDDNSTTITAPPIGIDTPLVDSEGYPRSDIDLYRARSLRKRFHEIKTDHKVLETKIERGLIELSALQSAALHEKIVSGMAKMCSGGSSSNNSENDVNKEQQDIIDREAHEIYKIERELRASQSAAFTEGYLSSMAKMCSGNNSENGGNKQQQNIIDKEAKELKARQAPKPKPKFDPVTGKWVVKSWDGSVAGVKDGEVRKFDDLSHSLDGALASIVGGTNRGGDSSSSGSSNGRVESSNNSNVPQQQQQQGTVSNSTSATQSSTIQPTPSQQQPIALKPFAIIDQVFPNSPTEQAGINEGDFLLRFGTVTFNNGGFDTIKRGIVTELSLASSNDTCISVAVRRTTSELGGIAEMIRVETFDLYPRSDWGGRGLLGCHLQEYSE